MTSMKNALITGASSGIGLEFARQLAAKGCSLAIISNRQEELESAAKSIRDEFPVQVQTLCIDLSESGAAGKVAAWCDETCFQPDVLVNNAGMFFMHYLDKERLPLVRKMIGLHVQAITELCIIFGERMRSRSEGYILNVASMTARLPAPGIAIYSASKAYLMSFGKSLSYELRPYGVKLTTVCPAAVDTGLYPLGDKLRRTLRRLGIIMSTEKLVRKSLRALRHGRRELNPGFGNFLVPVLMGIVPARLIDSLGMKLINK